MDLKDNRDGWKNFGIASKDQEKQSVNITANYRLCIERQIDQESNSQLIDINGKETRPLGIVKKRFSYFRWKETNTHRYGCNESHQL